MSQVTDMQPVRLVHYQHLRAVSGFKCAGRGPVDLRGWLHTSKQVSKLRAMSLSLGGCAVGAVAAGQHNQATAEAEEPSSNNSHSIASDLSWPLMHMMTTDA